jgi:hypothetical protein
MKQILITIFTAVMFFTPSAHASSEILNNLYVVMIDQTPKQSSLNIQRCFSLSDYADLTSHDDGQGLREEFPNAAFVLIEMDQDQNKLTYTTPGAVLQKLGRYPVHQDDIRFSDLAAKTATLFCDSCQIAALTALWTMNNVLLPGWKNLLKQSSELMKFLHETVTEQRN